MNKYKKWIKVRKLTAFILRGMIFGVVNLNFAYAAQALVAEKVDELPVLNGRDDDKVWTKAQEIVTRDKVAGIDIRIKAVYTDKDICFLVKFPDPDESRTHKSWAWSKVQDSYVDDSDREDVFQLVFSMENHPADLSVYADNNYKADVWFWKACRTDPAGYADDKMNILSDRETDKSTVLTSRTGKKMYLLRPQDAGTSCFEPKIYDKYEGNRVPGFVNRVPSGSVADIKAKGIWQNGTWTIELLRAINTGHNDDLQFDIKKEYLFGVSRYEIAGRSTPDPQISQPLYGCGDVTEELKLVFGKK